MFEASANFEVMFQLVVWSMFKMYVSNVLLGTSGQIGISNTFGERMFEICLCNKVLSQLVEQSLRDIFERCVGNQFEHVWLNLDFWHTKHFFEMDFLKWVSTKSPELATSNSVSNSEEGRARFQNKCSKHNFGIVFSTLKYGLVFLLHLIFDTDFESHFKNQLSSRFCSREN